MILAPPPDNGQRFESLARLAQAVSGSLELSEVLDAVAATALGLLPGTCARIWVAENDQLCLRAEAGTREHRSTDYRIVLAVGEGLVGQVAAAQQLLMVDDVRDDPRLVDEQWARAEGHVSFIGIPLHARDHLVGVLSLVTRQAHQFTLHEIEMLGAFADQAAVAIENTRLYESVATRMRRLQSLTRLNQLISSSLDSEALLREIAQAAATLMGAPGATFWVADEESRTLRRLAFSDSLMDDFPRAEFSYDEAVLGWIATRRQAVNVPDVFADGRFLVDWWRSHNLTSFLGIPVVLDGTLVAVLGMHSRKPFRIDTDDHALLQSFTAQAAVAIRNADLFAASEHRRRAAEALAEVGQGLAQALDGTEVSRRVVESVSSLIGAEGARLYGLDPETGDLVLLAAAGSAPVWSHRHPQGTAAIGAALRQRQAVWSADILDDARIVLERAARARLEQDAYRAALAVPLVANGKPLGALAIAATTGRTFRDEEVRLAQAFADQAALALDRAQLVDELRARQARQEALLDITRQIAGLQPLDSLLDSIAKACGGLLGCESVGFRLLEGEDLVVRGTHGDASDVMRKPRLKLGESISGRVAATGRPVIINDLAQDDIAIPEHRDAARRLGYQAIMVVPVTVGDRMAGVLSVRTRRPEGFSDTDLATATAFAAQAAVAVENARLYSEATRRRRAAEELAALTRLLAETLDVEAVGQRVVASVLPLFGVGSAVLRLLRPDGSLVIIALGGAAVARFKPGDVLPPGVGLVGRVAIEGRAQAISDLWAETGVVLTEDFRARILAEGNHAHLAAPLRVKSNTIGVLSVHAVEIRTFTTEEITLLQAFADRAAVALENARLYEESERRRRTAEALLEVAQALGSTLHPEAILKVVAQRAAQAVNAEHCAIYRQRHDRMLPLAVQWADGREDAAPSALLRAPGMDRLDEIPAYVEAVRLRGPVAIADTADTSTLPPGWMEGATSLLIAPIFHQDTLLGLLSFARTGGPAPWTQDQLDAATTIANQMALAVENARLFDAEREEAEVAGALLQLARAVEGLQDLDTMLETVARIAPHLLGMTRCALFLADPASDTLVPTVAFGLDARRRPVFFGLRAPATIPAVVEAIRSYEPVFIENASADTRIPRRLARAFDVRSMLVIPLVSGGRLMGVMAVDTPGQATVLREKQITLARGIAAHAAGAIDRAQLHLESERRRREAEVFAELARTVNASLDLEIVLHRVGEWARELCRSDSAIIALREPDSGVMAFRYFFGSPPEPGLRIEPDKGAGGYVMVTGQPFRTANYAADPRITKDYLDSVKAAGTVAEMVVPIRSGSRIEGLVYVANRARRPFTDRDEAVLVRLADHAAIAIHNAQLYTSAQAARTEAEALGQRYRNLVESSLQGVFIYDGETIKFANAAYARILGFDDPADVIGRSHWSFIAPSELERLHGYAAARREGQPAPPRYEYQAVRKDGRSIWIETLATMTSWEGAPAYLCACLDITERKRTEDALREGNARIRAVLDAAIDCIITIDHQGRITEFNPAAERTFGYTREEALGREMAELIIPPALRERHRQGLARVHATGHSQVMGQRIEMTALRADGTEFPVELTVSRIQSDGPPAFTGFVRDISERKRAEDALRRNEQHVRQMQKMEAVGRLAGGIAHDFNNLLTVITGRAQLLLRRLRQADPMRREMELIQKTAERASALTGQLLAFSRKQVLQPKVVSVEAIVHGLAPMLRRLLGEDIDLDIVPATDAALVKVDPGQLEQVIVNLAVNARDAMPTGGRLAIETARLDLDAATAQGLGGLEAGAHVMLAVSDSGVGMDEETRARIFEPFFTTKGPGHGTGLGLATVYGIVKQHQGAIAVDSVAGRGTTFRIYLPMTTEPLEAPRPERPAGLPGGTETVLLVEDELEVRALARDILQQVGYTVLEAANGPEAVEICREYPEAIQLLLTDVIMPHMSGRELAERADLVRPGLKTLYMSGYTSDALAPRALLAGDRVLLQKPFTPEALARRVREVLDS